MNRFRLPSDDESPVAQAATPEEREYQIVGVIGDDEVGQSSAVVPG